jgi:glyoxylase-like metal-dependent hydrolase (beta-lactamase superfamily II)
VADSADLPVTECGQIRAYLLRSRLPHPQPRADSPDRGNPPGLHVGGEHLSSLYPQRIRPGYGLRVHAPPRNTATWRFVLTQIIWVHIVEVMRVLPAPSAWAGPLPEAAPPADMAIYQLPTGTYETRAAFAVSGGSFRDKRQFAATAILVEHPKGDLLIDAGFGSDVAAHLAALPRFQRAPHQVAKTVSQQLDASGCDRSRLLGVLVTHAHWDHVSGLGDLRVPIWINPTERHYGAEDRGGKVFRIVSAGHEVHEYEFNGPPYLGFPSSFDVHGDGSVVVVPAAGHTPGSVVVFVTVPSGKRYAFIGDLTWQLDGIRRRVERPLLMRKLADSDPAQVREALLRVIALADLMQIVPAHDVHAHDGIPDLPVRLAPAPPPGDAKRPQ